MRRIAELHLEKLGADRDMAIVFQIELRGSTKFMEEFSAAGFAEYFEIIQQTIEEGQKSGVFRKDLNPIVCAKILLRRTRRNGDKLDFVEKILSARADGRRSFKSIFRRHG